MDNLKNLRMEFRRDGARDTECFVYVKADLPEEHPLRRGLGAGQGGMELFFDRDRLEEFSRSSCRVQDSYRIVEASGDLVLYYNLQWLHDPSREERAASAVTVPYMRIVWPMFVRRWMRRVALRVWDLPAWKAADWRSFNSWEYRPVVPIVGAERMLKLYGQGKGQVQIVASDETLDRVRLAREADAARGDDRASFEAQFEHVLRIARNSTRGHHQTATVRLSPDPAGFGWSAFTSRGRFIMNGGLLYHGAWDGFGSGAGPTFAVTMERCDGWSVHT